MKHLRVIEYPSGSKSDYEAEFVPRIGERIMLTYGRGNDPVRIHYHRVKDVMYDLDNRVSHQVAILIEEEENAEHWPS